MISKTVIPDKEEKRGAFASEFRKLSVDYRIRGLTIAQALDVTPQYVSKLLTAKNLPTLSQLNIILQLFESAGADVDERHLLINGFIRDKTGFLLEYANEEYNAQNTLERRLLADFRQLKPEQQREVLKLVADFSIRNMQGDGI